MQSRRRIPLLAIGVCASLAAAAAGPQARGEFLIEDPVTHKRDPAEAARLDQYVCFTIHVVLVPDGDHLLQYTIYDGQGNERDVLKAKVVSSDQNLERVICHSFDEDHDAVGTWWYVVELDGEPLLSQSFEVRAR